MVSSDPGEDEVFIASSSSFNTEMLDNSGSKTERFFKADGLEIVKTVLGSGGTWMWDEDEYGSAHIYVVKGTVEFKNQRLDNSVMATEDSFVRTDTRDVDTIENTGVGQAELVVGFNTEISDDLPSDGGVEVATTEDLKDTNSLKNVGRKTPFGDNDVRQVRGHAEGVLASEWHHHGNNHVFGYIIDGAVFAEVGFQGQKKFVEVKQGDFFHWPKEFIHRERNLQPGRVDYALWMTGDKPRMVKVDNNGESIE